MLHLALAFVIALGSFDDAAASPCATDIGPHAVALLAGGSHTGFFDATLRQDTAADCFLRHRLEDDAPEVTSAPAADSERRRRLLAGKGGT